MKAIKYLSIFAIAVIFASCAKDGATGATGPQGPQGNNGVANINTQIFSVGTGGWSYASSAAVWYVTFTESDITNNNTDIVEAYWSNSSSSSAGWLALPQANLWVVGDNFTYGFNDNSITISYYGNTPNAPSAYEPNLYFKVTVIPPAIQKKYPGTNWKDAAQVSLIPEVQAALNSGSSK